VPIVTNGRAIWSSSRLSLGQKDSPEACIAVAKDEPACIGGEVAVSSWGCYCLKNACYASSNSYYTSSYYDLYRHIGYIGFTSWYLQCLEWSAMQEDTTKMYMGDSNEIMLWQH